MVIEVFCIWITSVVYIWFWCFTVVLHNITIWGNWRRRTWDLCFSLHLHVNLCIYFPQYKNFNLNKKIQKNPNNLGGRVLHGRCYIIKFCWSSLTKCYILELFSPLILSTLSPLPGYLSTCNSNWRNILPLIRSLT